MASEHYHCASYFEEAFTDQKGLIAIARRKLHRVEYDLLVGTEVSGALATPLLAYALRKDLALVRKNKGAHSHRMVETVLPPKDVIRWVFVDDFISTGKTLRRVKRRMAELARKTGRVLEFVGVYSYHNEKFTAPGALTCE